MADAQVPDSLLYTEEHEYVLRASDDEIVVGITDYAQGELSDIVFVELPDVGSTFTKTESFGTIEAVKAVSELYLPVGGEIMAVNGALEDAPELINNTPYSDGWMIEVKPDAPDALAGLMTKDAYLTSLKG